MAAEDLKAFAQTAIELSDGAMAKQAMRQARMQEDEEVVQMLLESRLVATTKAGRAFGVTEKARKAARDRDFQILTEGDFSFLQKVEYLCPMGHQFTASPKSFARSKQPCPLCAKTRVERMQVNVRLSIEHTEKYLELIEYYKSKEGITFLGEQMSPSELESNSTALGRFLLETALEDAYMELKDQKTIEEIASWIDFDDYKNFSSIVHELGTNPWRHKEENSEEWRRFNRAKGLDKENHYLSLAISKWGKNVGDRIFTQFFEKALMLAIQNHNSINTSPLTEDRELERRMRRWKRNE